MEIVYRTKQGVYPFNRPKDTELTYVQHIISNSLLPLTQQLREIIRAYKSIQCPYLIRLNKFLKNENEIHFFFNYYPTSVQLFLNNKPQAILQRLRQQLTCALQCLQKADLKAEASIENIAIDSDGSLKLFITPQNLSKGDNLNEFYVTEKTRLLMQLQQIWSQDNNKDVLECKPQNPGFRISGNELIFIKNQNQNELHNGQKLQKKSIKHKKQQINSVHSTQSILAQIQKQKQKAKKLKAKHNHLNGQTQHKGQQLQKHGKLSKKHSTNQDNQPMRESHKSQLNFTNKKPVEEKLISSAAQPSNQSYSKYNRNEDRPSSSIRNDKQTDNHQNQLSYEDIRAIAIKHLQSQGKQVKQEPRIQVTTEMVSRYKMKIVTCQQIQFQGKQGDDIQKLAQEKLIEYQQQYSLPSLSIQNVGHHSSDETITRATADKSGSFQECHDRKEKTKVESTQSEQIMNKIQKAKEKAENVLKEYAKNKKK